MNGMQIHSMGSAKGRATQYEEHTASLWAAAAVGLVLGIAIVVIWRVTNAYYPLDGKSTIGVVRNYQLPASSVAEALRRLAQQAGISIPQNNPTDDPNERTARFDGKVSAVYAAQAVLWNTRHEVVPPADRSVKTLDIVSRTGAAPSTCPESIGLLDYVGPRPLSAVNYYFNLPALPMNVALECWSLVTGLPVYVHRRNDLTPVEVRDLLATMKSQEINGPMKVTRALKLLIEGAHPESGTESHVTLRGNDMKLKPGDVALTLQSGKPSQDDLDVVLRLDLSTSAGKR